MTSWIEVNHKWVDAVPKGYFEDEYTWQGEGDIAECHELDKIFWHNGIELKGGILPGQVLTLGQLRLRVIDRPSYYWLVARDGWKARLYQYLWPAKKRLRWVYCRLIVTLAVWGLATYESGRAPSWKDIKWPKKL